MNEVAAEGNEVKGKSFCFQYGSYLAISEYWWRDTIERKRLRKVGNGGLTCEDE